MDRESTPPDRGALKFGIAAVVVALLAVAITALVMSSGGDGTEPTTTEVTEQSTDSAVATSTTELPAELPTGLHVAVEPAAYDDESGRGAVWTSTDATEWSRIEVDLDPGGVATDDSVVVVVGAARPAEDADGADTDETGGAGGTDGTGGTTLPPTALTRPGKVLISRDGSDWTESVDVPDELTSVTRGADRWVATGLDSDSEGGRFRADAVVYTSSDGSEWTKVATIPGSGPGYEELGELSIRHGPGGYLAWGTECLGDGCVVLLFHSVDAEEWTPVDGQGLAGAAIGARAGEWLLAGAAGNDLSGYGGLALRSTDGTEWQRSSMEPAELNLFVLCPTAGGWVGPVPNYSAAQVTTEVWSSADGTAWVQGTIIEAEITDMAAVGAPT